MAPTQVRPIYTRSYGARGAALNLMHVRDSEVLVAGPAGTGKSRACLEKIHLVAKLHPKTRILVCRKTQVSLAPSALKTYREHVATLELQLGHVIFHGGGPQDPPQYRYINQVTGETESTITIAGLDKPTKIMSTEFDLVYIQEATELDITDWEFLLTRLRNWNISYQQLIADCNPDTPTHWLKQRCDQGKTRMLHSRHEDNPVLFDEDGTSTPRGAAYMEKLDALTGVRKLRLRDGKWVAAEGQIFEDWAEGTHLAQPFEVPKEWPRYWGVDFGFTNPFVLQCWAEDPDGRLVMYREIYQTRRLVEDHAAHILNIVAPKNAAGRRVWKEPKPQWVVCDHDAEGRETLKRHLGLPMRNAKKDVEDGIQAVQKRLRVAGDGRPRLYLMRHCVVKRDPTLEDAKKPTCTQEEIPGYVWDDSSKSDTEKETPNKENDHGCDTIRYVVMQRDKGGNPGIKRM